MIRERATRKIREKREEGKSGDERGEEMREIIF